MALWAVWPLALLFPAPVTFGLGQVLERVETALAQVLQDTPWLEWLPLREVELQPLLPVSEILCVAIGLLLPCLLAFGVLRLWGQRMVVAALLVGVGFGASALSAALTYGPAHAWGWVSTEVLAGLVLAIVAMAALSFCGAGVLEEAVTGSRRRGVPEAVVTPQDVFHVGSITKSMTAVVAASMVEAGVISWTTAVGEVLGGLPLHDDVKPVTLWQLLRHRSGLRRDLPGDLQERLGREGRSLMEQRRGLARVMLAEPLEQPLENGYSYSNAGYTMAGLMLETAAGQAWEELVAARVFLPLGLTSAGFGAPARTPTVTDQPWGHRADGSVVEPGPGDDNGPAMGPAGTVHLSLPDLATYARWHLREATPSPPLVTAASVAPRPITPAIGGVPASKPSGAGRKLALW